MCSKCGYIHRKLRLSERIWECPACGAVHERDENAAKNLKTMVLFIKKNTQEDSIFYKMEMNC